MAPLTPTQLRRRERIESVIRLASPGLDLLLTVIDEEPVPTAIHAVESMVIYKNDAAVSARVRTVVESRGDRTLTAAFMKHFERR